MKDQSKQGSIVNSTLHALEPDPKNSESHDLFERQG